MNNFELYEIKDLKKIQSILLNIFIQFKSFCESHKLQYYITGGTLLGAIRYNGFIPWDDDLDVCMPRPDYERLIKLMQMQGRRRYQIQAFALDNVFPHLYARFVDSTYIISEKYLASNKAVHFGIDVFPIDGIPSNNIQKKSYYLSLRLLRKIFIFSTIHPFKGSTPYKSLLKPLICIPCKVWGTSRIFNLIQYITSKYPYETSSHVGISIGYYGKKEEISAKQMSPTYVTFESLDVPAYRNPHSYLQQLYGKDYLIPPSTKEQQRHHSFTLWKKYTRENNYV